MKRKQESLEQKIGRVVREQVIVVDYDPEWPERFDEEKKHLTECIPPGVIGRIEHFGSTAVPGMAAKPVIDMLVEAVSLEKVRKIVPPILESQGYDYFWRPTWGDDVPPYYAWFIKRDAEKNRTHHIHMVESNFEHWDRLLFRDYLIEHPEEAAAYKKLKLELAGRYSQDRVRYTEAKTEFITRITRKAKHRFCAE